MIRTFFFFFALFFLALTSCTNNRLEIDASAVKVNVDFVNLDSIITTVPTTSLPTILDKYANSSEGILAYQLGHCLGIGGFKDQGSLDRIQMFRTEPYIKRLEKQIATTFKSKSDLQSQILDGFSHLKYHFPKHPMPTTIFYINSLFVSNVFCSSNEIGIGLDRYLGAKTSVIKELPSQEFFQWMKDGMRKEYIPRDVLSEWIAKNMVTEVDGAFADKMIRWGKILYLTEAAFPNMDKHLLFRYTKNGYDWAEHNETSIWKYLVNEELLFSKNERDHANFLNEGPFTVGLPEKSPDRLGQYLGWRIVHEFMDNNESVSLQQLINVPYNTILQSYEIEE
jgi:hypothetical protein